MMKGRLAVWAVALCISSGVQAQSLEETVAFCEDCHGKGGVSLESDVPTIAGFQRGLLEVVFHEESMSEYKRESRLPV